MGLFSNPAFSEGSMNRINPNYGIDNNYGGYGTESHQNVISERIPDFGTTVSAMGVFRKLAILIMITFAAALVCMSFPQLIPVCFILSLLDIILAIIMAFKPEWAKILAPVYAVCEGGMLGGLTYLFNEIYPGIGVQAVLLTFFAAFGCLAVYRSNVFSASFFSNRTVMAGLLAVIAFSFFGALDSWLGWGISIFDDFSPIGILINVAILIFFLYVFLVDCQNVTEAIKSGVSKTYEWYLAYGMLLTIILIYLQILKILAATRRK